MITQNNQEITKEQKVIKSLQDIVISADEANAEDIEFQTLSKLRYIVTAHYAFIEEFLDDNPLSKAEQTGFYLQMEEVLNTLSITSDLKSKYIKYLELNQVKQ